MIRCGVRRGHQIVKERSEVSRGTVTAQVERSRRRLLSDTYHSNKYRTGDNPKCTLIENIFPDRD